MEAHIVIRPSVTDREVYHLAKEKYGLSVSNIRELPSFVDRNFMLTVFLSKDVERTFILKITNSEFSEKRKELSLQHAAMSALKQNGFFCTQVLKNVFGDELSVFDFPGHTQDGQKNACVVRLMTYLPGNSLHDYIDHVDKHILYEIGQLIGEIHKTLKTLPSNLDEDDKDNCWRVENIKQLEMYLKPKDCKNKLLLEVINGVQKHALEQSSMFTKGITHGDIRDMNMIVNFKDGKFQPLFPANSNATSPMSKYGVIDFGDLTQSSYAFDVAIAIADFMVECNGVEFCDTGAHILAGYLTVEKLTVAEFDVLYYIIAARYCQYIVLGEHTYETQPDNEYTKLSSEKSWEKIQMLWNSNKSDVYAIWKRIMSEDYGITLDM